MGGKIHRTARAPWHTLGTAAVAGVPPTLAFRGGGREDRRGGFPSRMGMGAWAPARHSPWTPPPLFTIRYRRASWAACLCSSSLPRYLPSFPLLFMVMASARQLQAWRQAGHLSSEQ